MNEQLSISEIFGPTIQGEGRYMGRRVGFIRTCGCNLKWRWGNNKCDTSYTSWNPEGKKMSIEEIVEEVDKLKVYDMVISGGEPYIQFGLFYLIKELKNKLYQHITIETNGTIFFPTFADFISISPKLKSSIPIGTEWEQLHNQRRCNFEAMKQLIQHHDYQMKFVVSSPEDIAEIFSYQNILDIPCSNIWLMPEGVTKSDLEKTSIFTVETAIKYGYNYSDRLHIRLWNDKKGV